MRQMLDELNPTCDLQVDGGVGPANIGDVVNSGANVIVAGSAVYNDRAAIADNIAALRAGYANVQV
jgi:ribulose-phosphate 3-epimerase